MLSSVSFRAGALDSARDVWNQPQTHSKPQVAQTATTDAFVQPKKKNKVLKAVLGTLAAAAVVVGSLVAGHKMGGFTKLIEKAGAEGAGKFAKTLGTVAEHGEKWGKAICEFGVNALDKVKNLFPKKAA